VFDLTYLRSVPNLMVMAPADGNELVDMLHTALAADGPVAIRYPRGTSGVTSVSTTPQTLEAGKAEVRRVGTDVALVAVGRMVKVAEKAADELLEAGVAASVVNVRWVKPMDLETISWAAASHHLVVTVEENTGCGGMGAAVMESLSDLAVTAPILRLSIPDLFVTHGSTEKLLAEVGLTSAGVRDAVLGRLADLTGGKGRAHDADSSRRRSR
jgi:1-deoxy-D-xylulose-5-phosphate synthase